MTKTFTSYYYDLRESTIYCDNVIRMFRKQAGIVLNSCPQRGIKIIIKLSHNDAHREIEVFPIVPEKAFPPLPELIKRSEYPQHDKLRFDLLKWMIGEEMLRAVNLEAIPEEYFHSILVLVHMVVAGYITPEEADIILLTIKHVETDTVPENVTVPFIVHPRAFATSYLYIKCYILMSRCLEVVGLKRFQVRLPTNAANC